jgi:small-conductance mechanosensitive channel
MKWLVALAFLLLMALDAGAQSPPAQSKIDDLVRLLQDPEVRTWLESQKPAPPAAQTAAPASGLPAWEIATRRRINAITSAVPRIPGEVATASGRVRQDAISRGYAPVMLIFAGLVVVGVVAETLFRLWRPNRAGAGGPAGALATLLPLAVFAGTMAVIFFAVEWPPLARIVLLSYLIAFVVYRFASALADIACHRRPGLLRRIRIFLGVAVFAVASASLGESVGLDPAVATAISYTFSIVLLVLAVETLWRTSRRGLPAKLGLTAFLVAVWILWCLDLRGLFWIGIYALVLPDILRSVGRSVEAAIPSPPDSRRSVLLVRGSRAAVVALAAAWIALIWHVNSDSLAHQNPTVTRILYGLLKSVVVLLLADLVWHLARAHIDRTLATSAVTTGLSPADLARRGRLRTLLPIIRNALAAMVAVMAGLIVLSELGVEIGPLIAGAGIFGVAIGFGSQTLVKDVISGIFYMLDDAFRVGEYIQAKSYKGTVEGFSLRSVRLRHHRGPVFTIPFGELGAVENMSRDWVIDKFRISVGYNTDIGKARKITKAIGAELQADPEVGSLFIEPLKMKGVEEFGDYGIVLSFAMTTVPGQQTYIRRKAYAMIRDAFQTNGIEFAQPTVQVGGDDKGAGAAAATAVRATQLKQATEGE